LLSASNAATYILIAPTRTSTIITLEPCALKCWVWAFHTEISYFADVPLREGIGGEREGKDKGDFSDNSII
jgi:hypothetical protein